MEQLRGFACYHGDDGKAACEALREEVCAELECEPDRLVTAVVYNLEGRYSVAITGIPSDMWSAVNSDYRRYVTEEEYDALPEDAGSDSEWVTEATAYIECDSIEDGFALTWKTWKEWFAKRADQTPESEQ